MRGGVALLVFQLLTDRKSTGSPTVIGTAPGGRVGINAASNSSPNVWDHAD